MRYDGRWRDRDPKEAPPGVAPVIRLKAPQNGQTVIQDAVQGEVTVENAQLDDMVLLRADGTPTYMLAVVVDDHDMGITHVIRGDDHLNNAFRQMQIIKAMGWPEPVYAHIPLIHGPTAPSSASATARSASTPIATWASCPRRCATTCCGWAGAMATTRSSRPSRRSSGSTCRASAARPRASTWPSSPTSMRTTCARRPMPSCCRWCCRASRQTLGRAVDAAGLARIERGMSGVKQRSRTVIELADNLVFYARDGAPPIADDKARAQLTPDSKALLARLAAAFDGVNDWSEKQLEEAVRRFAEAENVKLGQVAQPLRVALSGSTASPGIFEVVAILGPAETKKRLLAAGG